MATITREQYKAAERIITLGCNADGRGYIVNPHSVRGYMPMARIVYFIPPKEGETMAKYESRVYWEVDRTLRERVPGQVLDLLRDCLTPAEFEFALEHIAGTFTIEED
jgi:hypothetical protein